MNERIKELILECVNFRLDPDSNAYEAQVCPEDLECLVELVVCECANIARNTDLEDIEGGDSAVLGAARDQILEHFGVK